jgi:hypothetical protein
MNKTYSMQGVNRNTNTVLIGIPHGKMAAGISRYKWECYIKMNLMSLRS